jgi:hypothetical protein
MQVPDSDTRQVLLALLDVPMGSLASYNCITHCTFAVLDELRESDPSAHTPSVPKYLHLLTFVLHI